MPVYIPGLVPRGHTWSSGSLLGSLLCHANLFNSSHWPLGTFLLLWSQVTRPGFILLVSPFPGPPLPHFLLPGIQLSLLTEVTNCLPADTSPRLCLLRRNAFVFKRAFLEQYSHSPWPMLSLSLQELSNPASSRKAFLIALVHPDPGLL